MVREGEGEGGGSERDTYVNPWYWIDLGFSGFFSLGVRFRLCASIKSIKPIDGERVDFHRCLGLDDEEGPRV